MSLDLAREYLAQGWPVFPCRDADEEVIDPETGEVTVRRAKEPLTPHGLRNATKLARIVDRWWADHPTAMVGVPTGEPIGAWVLDVDVDPEKGVDGYAKLAELEAEHGELGTRYAKTPRGGLHFYFRHKPGVTNSPGLLKGSGIDVRGDGGFVIAPGSVTADGRQYEWQNPGAPIAEAPQWLLDLISPPRTERPAAAAALTHDYAAPRTNDAYIDAAFDAELARLGATSEGGRGYQLNASAFSLGQLVGAGAVSRSEAEAGLYAAAAKNGLLAKDGERAVRATIRRGLNAGERQPREVPEPEFSHDGTPRIDLTSFIDNARRRARERDGAAPVEEPIAADLPSTEPLDDPPDLVEDELVVRATPFAWKDPKTIELRDFVYGSHLVRKYVSVTVSPGGIGKTSLTIAEALAMITGRPLLGVKPRERLNVWVFNAEDPRDEMERRIMAAALHYKLKPEDFDGRLFLDTGREQDLVIAYEERNGVKVAKPVVGAIIDQIIRNRIDVMIVDPFVSTHGVSENDNGAIDRVAKLWAKIADETNTAIEIVHHVRKVDGREVTVDDARGAVSLISASRSARVLNRMSEEQAKTAGIQQRDRFSYFSVQTGKANLAPLSGGDQWRRLESVGLGNGRGLARPQDHAGVVVEWKWPTREDMVGEITAEQIDDIKNLLRGGSYKSAANGKPWGGEAVAAVLGIDIEEKSNRARIKSMIEQWIDDGHLAVSTEHDPMTRKSASFLRAA